MNRKANSGTHMVDLLFTLALFCVFAASALMVVLIGANVYQNTVEGMDESFSTRTSLTYVATKVRQNDLDGAAYLDTLDGQTALVLEQELAGSLYQTWIYYYDGYLRETFTQAGNPVTPQDGQAILEVAGFDISVTDSPVEAFIVSSIDGDGNVSRRWVAPRCGIADRKGAGA